MAEPIGALIEALRRAGVRISPSERIEASRAALAVEIDSRPLLKAALRVTLAKTREESLLVDEVFDDLFVRPRGGTRGKGTEGAGGDGGSRKRGLTEPSEPGRRSRSAPKGTPPEEARNRKDAARPPRRQDDRRRGPPPTGPQRRRTRVLLQPLSEREGDRHAQRRDETDPRRGANPMRLSLRAPLTLEEEESLAREVPRIIQEIRLRTGRRFRKGRRGRLWLKRVLRDSLRTGGVPFGLPMKRRRPRRPKVILLVDVSWSVARAAGLFLMIAAGLAKKLPRTRVLLFVDRAVEAPASLMRWSAGRRESVPPSQAGAAGAGPGPRTRRRPGAGLRPRAGRASFAEVLSAAEGLHLDAASDYGRVFYQAREAVARGGGRDVLLVVLGDARSNRRDPLAWAFEEMASRCRRVIWLNPEPRGDWDSEDSVMSAYQGSCDVVVEARDLRGLARGVAEIVRGL